MPVSCSKLPSTSSASSTCSSSSSPSPSPTSSSAQLALASSSPPPSPVETVLPPLTTTPTATELLLDTPNKAMLAHSATSHPPFYPLDYSSLSPSCTSLSPPRPLTSTSAPTKPSTHVRRPSVPVPNKYPNLRVALVDDNEINHKILAKILEKSLGLAPHQIDVFFNGQLCLDALALNQYDLLLLDIEMPILDGCQTTHFIRHAHSPEFMPVASTCNPPPLPRLDQEPMTLHPPLAMLQAFNHSNPVSSSSSSSSLASCHIPSSPLPETTPSPHFLSPTARKPSTSPLYPTTPPSSLPIQESSSSSPPLADIQDSYFIPCHYDQPHVLFANRQVPIVAVTCNGRQDQQREYMALGADAVICKPVQSSKLVRTIERLITLRTAAAATTPL
ncbi:hypothetical protein DFS34DRAFT_115979 [Phlyctochytrium arcticum]|nr:hypothetical protein DFS34DRAFT_115979 [Phlyctochytrium arcticum]